MGVVLILIWIEVLRAWSAAPQGLVVELDAFPRDITVDHGSDEAVAEREAVFFPGLIGVRLVSAFWVLDSPTLERAFCTKGFGRTVEPHQKIRCLKGDGKAAEGESGRKTKNFHGLVRLYTSPQGGSAVESVKIAPGGAEF